MCLTALEHTRLPQPGLSAQISSRTPPSFLLRCCELLRLGMGMPAMFNSDVLVLGMVNRGKTLEDARASSLNGCVAGFCDGKDRMASTRLLQPGQVPRAGAQRRRGPADGRAARPARPATRARSRPSTRCWRPSARRWRTSSTMKVRYDNIVRDIYATHCPVPFTSAVIDDCIEHGARLARRRRALQRSPRCRASRSAPWPTRSSAIRTHVFEQRRVHDGRSSSEALDRNWEGHEIAAPDAGQQDAALRQRRRRGGRAGGAGAATSSATRSSGTATSRARATGSTCCRRRPTSRSAR